MKRAPKNVLGRVAGVQQVRLQLLIDLMSEKKAEKTEENCESSARALLVVNEAVKPKPAVSTMKEETARWELPRPDSLS